MLLAGYIFVGVFVGIIISVIFVKAYNTDKYSRNADVIVRISR